MTANGKCAIYARVSSDKQNPLSPQDQVRKCREFAEQNALEVLAAHIYIDEGLSGVGSDRPAFLQLLAAAFASERDFDVLLIDDTSRLSRSQSEVMGTVEKLRYMGVRVVFPSQGIDTNSEQADVQITVHGLVDSMYVKELAQKTHRGLESRALQGLHTGGVCYGYTAVRTGESEAKRLVINENEARIVRRIFGMYAKGLSLKGIPKQLNAELVPPPRSKSPSGTATWCYTAIREMLRRPLYIGEKVWNCSQFQKVPGTNKRRSRPRPESEWIRISLPELAIVSRELWDAVQTRLKSVRGNGGNRTRLGLLSRGFTSRYLFSSLLKCGKCGSNLIIQTSGNRKRKYVCSSFMNRGVCTNNLYIPQEEVERVLLTNLKDDLLRPESVAYVIEEFGRQLRTSLESLSSDVAQWRSRKEKLEREIRNLTKAIAESGHSKSILDEISVREREIGAITDRLLSSTAESIEGRITEIRSFVEQEIQNLSNLLNTNSPLVKQELHRHISSITMHPVGDGREWHYEAEGSWNLLGTDEKSLHEEPAAQDSNEGHLRLVAGAGFEPATFGL
jgi:DNA invertase Pin-like site-specific DNA recombinase